MKKVIALMLTLVMCLSVFTFAAEVTDENVIYLDFENGVPDNVLVEGELTYDNGIEGNAAVFNGETYLELPNVTENLEDFTLSAWIKFDAITPNVWQRVFDFGGEEGSNFFFGVWQWEGSNNLRVGIPGVGQATTFGVFKLGQWIHYTVVQRGEILEVYLNGRLATSCEALGNLKEYDIEKFYVGNYNKNTEPTELFHGCIDEFFIAPYAMDEADINSIAFDYLSDEEKIESLSRRVYLKNIGDGFEYFSFDDGHSAVMWESSKPDVLTIEGIKDYSKELKDVVITATVKSGKFEKIFKYEFVVGEFDGEIKVKETTLEKIEIDEIRQNNAIEIDTSKTYLIKKKGEDVYLTQNDGVIAKTNDANDKNAVWRFHSSPKTNKTYAIYNVSDGRCLNLNQFNTEKGANVILYDGGKGINELWYVVNVGEKTGILSYYSEWFMDEDGIMQGLDNVTDWEIIECERKDLTYGYESVDPDEKYETLTDYGYYALKCEKGYLAANNEIVFNRNSYAHNSQWVVTNIAGKYYTVINRVTNQNLNVAGGNKNAGANVILWNGAAGSNEQWIFEKTDKGYLIYGRDNNNYLAYTDRLIMSEKPYYWTLMLKGKKKVEKNDNGAEWVKDYITDYIPQISEEVIEGFVHPGIMINAEDIRRMQRNVRESNEPWLSSLGKLITNEYSTRDNLRIYAYDSGGDTSKIDNSGRLWNMRHDSRKVTNQALLYVITGDERYRANAMTIIRMWSGLRDVYRTVGSDRIDYGEISFRFAFAAELMKYSSTQNPDLAWTDADEEKFVGMLETIRYKHDATFYWMNQHSIGNTGTMANAIFRNDFDLYKTTVQRTTVNTGSIDSMTGSGGGLTQVFRIVNYDAHNGDEIEPTFVHAEMGRDQGHAYGNVAALSMCTMMAYRQNTLVDPVTGEYTENEDGVNIFEFADHRLLQGTNYIAKYNLGYEVMHPTIDVGGLYCDINDLNHGAIYTAFGIVYNYYKYEEKVDMTQEEYKYMAQAHEYEFPEGNIRDFYLGYSDLLYAPDDAENNKTERLGEGSNIWQAENFTALNWGNAEKCKGYAQIELDDKGTQIVLINGYFPPGTRNKVILKVRTTGGVYFEAKNENDVYSPFAEGIIPATNGEWKEIAFDVLSGRRLGTMVFYLNFKGEGTIEVDYMKFSE